MAFRVAAAVFASRHFAARAGASDPANPPALDAPAAEFDAFRSSLLSSYQAILDNPNWKDVDSKDGVNASKLTESSQGCPWVRATGLLENCGLEQSARFIMTDKSFQDVWDKTYVPPAPPIRTLDLDNGTQEISWHAEKDSAFLEQRVYYMYASWQWTSSKSIVLISNSFHAELSPPQGAPTGVRSTQWMWRRLTEESPTTTRYEVLYLSDLKGLVPCSLTVGGQAGSIRDEVDVFRAKIPEMAPPTLLA